MSKDKSIRMILSEAGFNWDGLHRILMPVEEGAIIVAVNIITDDDPIIDKLTVGHYSGPMIMAEDDKATYFSGDCADEYIIHRVSKDFDDYLLPENYDKIVLI